MIILAIVEQLLEFIESELLIRGWSWTELGNRADLSSGTMSNIRNGTRGAGKKTLNAIANALDVPAETLYRLGGILPAVSQQTEVEQRLLYLFRLLPPDYQEVVINQLQGTLNILGQGGGVKTD